MGPYVPICVPAILPGGESYKKGGSGKNYNNTDYTNMAITTMVPNALKNEGKESSPSSKFAKPGKKFPGRVLSIDKNKETKIGCVASFVQQLATKGMNEQG